MTWSKTSDDFSNNVIKLQQDTVSITIIIKEYWRHQSIIPNATRKPCQVKVNGNKRG